MLQQSVNEYLKQRAKPGRFWKELERRFHREIIPGLGNKPISEITKADIRQLIRSKQEKYPVAARTLYEALSPFFKWAASEDLIEASPMASLLPPEAPQARDRVLSTQELQALWRASTGLYGSFYRLLLLTGQRREEVARMAQAELEGSTWTIPGQRTKNGLVHIVYLSPFAQSLLPSCDPLFRIGGYSKVHARLLRTMGTAHWRIHDLRRTAASGMASLGFQPYIVDRVLNHISGTTRLQRIYQRYEYIEERKAALQAWSNYIENSIAIPGKDNHLRNEQRQGIQVSSSVHSPG